ncbi:hypothetical protein SCLCIDRAFT_1208017, partial [Scleroderma citrinum Foug A]
MDVTSAEEELRYLLSRGLLFNHSTLPVTALQLALLCSIEISLPGGQSDNRKIRCD